MDEAIVPFSKKTWSEIIFEKLKQLIEDGFWKPEEKIYTEVELCEKFNVSRSTVREAINMLKANNLVYAVPGAGTFVTHRQVNIVFANGLQPDIKLEKSLQDVMEFRLSVEPYSAFLAATRMSDDEIAKLDALHHKYAADLENGPQFFAETDMEFHLYIAQTTKNDLIIEAMHGVRTYLQALLITSNNVFDHREIAMSHHARVVDGIARRDPEAAEQAMREHMSEAFQFVQSIISSVKKGTRLEAVL